MRDKIKLFQKVQKSNSNNYQNIDKSEVSISNSSKLSTSFVWNEIVFIILATAFIRLKLAFLVTLVYDWNLNQSRRNGLKFIDSWFSICLTLMALMVLENDCNRTLSSSCKLPPICF